MTLGRPGLEDAKRVPVLDVARELGLSTHIDKRGEQSFGPCPSCGGTVRASDGKSDKRGRCRVFEDGQGWACNTNGSEGCGAKGDGPGLVSLKLCDGRAGPKGSDVRTVLDWYRERGGLDSGAGWSQGAHVPGVVPSEAPAAPVPANRPPRGELWRVWSQCVPVTQDDAVSAWLMNHHEGPIDPALVKELDLARALPMGLDLPRWAWGPGGRWDDAGYRVIVRLFGAGPDGAGLPTRSLHARNVRSDAVPKGVLPSGCDSRGLVMAWSPGMPYFDRPMEAPEASVLELAEGVPDWLRLTLERWRWQAADRATVWGCVSGSASDDIAARVPDGWCVALRMHDDDGGRRLLDRWQGLLENRCDVRDGRVPNLKKKGAA